MKSWNRVVIGLGLVVVSAAGCRCGPTNVGGSRGEIRFVYENGGVRVEGESGLYDFGPVPNGKTVTMKVIVRNIGSGSLSLRSFEKESGSPTRLGDVSDADPVFALDYGAIDVASGETKE